MCQECVLTEATQECVYHYLGGIVRQFVPHLEVFWGNLVVVDARFAYWLEVSRILSRMFKIFVNNLPHEADHVVSDYYYGQSSTTVRQVFGLCLLVVFAEARGVNVLQPRLHLSC